MKKRIADKFEYWRDDLKQSSVIGLSEDINGENYTIYDYDKIVNGVLDIAIKFLEANASKHIQTTTTGKQFVAGSLYTDLRAYILKVAKAEKILL